MAPFLYYETTFNFNLAIILLIILALKLIVVTILHHNGKKFKSELLIEAYKESKADLISTCVVLIIMLFAFFESYIPSYINIDKIGCFCMAIYVFYISITMLILNIKGMLANDVLNNEIRENINNELVFSKDGDTIWKCRNCGHIVIGKKAPDVCPVCAHPQAYFEIKADNYE